MGCMGLKDVSGRLNAPPGSNDSNCSKIGQTLFLIGSIQLAPFFFVFYPVVRSNGNIPHPGTQSEHGLELG